ncbi:hypothetical protein WR25_07398 [Diploscapter pachys]|uniref:Uncharacterized protein n=1 Tax=Diploscapter pachys TaxID=2018661 RepID=A0A2A2L3X8_9BILA|nr:hypothetical protein WR25_07398 [Diploscapter pachys]
MVGYLYAISHGAEWIYDTDDDNRPTFGGLDTFDFADELSGARFERSHTDELRTRLFNPYLHFGRPDMWPRGFPLEYYNLHNHTDANFRLCEKMKRAAVQQGLVDMDPDVDAIFRLLHANPTKVSSEHFNRHAPPVILGQKMYSPWNSQNTLFHRNAFFTMFLPTTVSFRFRTTDIWRSYFAQRLLHLVDEYVAFYPTNAVQIRNSHNYLVDMGEELKMKFWHEGDAELVKDWIHDLIEIGYTFPKLSKPTSYELPESDDIRNANCRRVFLQLFNDKPDDKVKSDEARAVQKMQNMDDLIQFCNKANFTDFQQSVTSPKTLAKMHANMPQLNKLQDIALIVVCNRPMDLRHGYSIIQRLYTPYFGTVIFCGSWYPNKQKFKRPIDPPLQYSFNYIHITPDEMHKGYNMEVCMIRAYELRLRNINGYFVVADDAMLSFWQPFNLDMVFHQWGTELAAKGRGWWKGQWGAQRMKNILERLKNESYYEIYKDTLEEYRKRLLARNLINEDENAITEFQKMQNWTCSDVYYVPSSDMPFFTNLMRLFYQNELFVELSLHKYLRVVDHQIAINGRELGAQNGARRFALTKYYSENSTFMHAIKLSGVIKRMDTRYTYCDRIIKAYHRVLFLNSNFKSGIDETIY